MIMNGIKVKDNNGGTIHLTVDDSKHLFLFGNDATSYDDVCFKLVKVDYEKGCEKEFEFKLHDGESIELHFSNSIIEDSACDNVKEVTNSCNLNQGVSEVLGAMRRELLELGLLWEE